jgi:hypothetical protein
MAMIAPPEGMSEADYESIEAAVMETVRGRWFLAEYARRSRVDEMHQMLDAIGKLEEVVREQQARPADPSIRLLVQRLKDVSQSLERMVREMRGGGLDERFCAAIESQARAVSGLLRLNNTSPPAAELHRPRALPEATPQPAKSLQHSAPAHADRRAALARLDQLPIAEKLALFG